MNAIGLKWQGRIARDIEGWLFTHHNWVVDKSTFPSTIQSKLAEYEAEYSFLKEATTTLELALWQNKMCEQSKIDSSHNKRIKIDEDGLRKQCRIYCGADVVIQHVLPYLV